MQHGRDLPRQYRRFKQAAGFNGKDATKAGDGQKLRPWIQDYMRHTAINCEIDYSQGSLMSWVERATDSGIRFFRVPCANSKVIFQG